MIAKCNLHDFLPSLFNIISLTNNKINYLRINFQNNSDVFYKIFENRLMNQPTIKINSGSEYEISTPHKIANKPDKIETELPLTPIFKKVNIDIITYLLYSYLTLHTGQI